MVTLTPRPPHQWHFDATPVFGLDGHVKGIQVTHGERSIYLDLPRELEKQVEEVLTDIEQLPEVPPFPIGPKPTILTRAKSAIKGKRK